MASITYKINDYSKGFLQRHKFRYSSYLSGYGDEIYTYRYPILSYNKITTIECEIAVSLVTGIVNVNVYNEGTKELYAPYYNREFGKYELLKSIDMQIDKKLKDLGIEMV